MLTVKVPVVPPSGMLILAGQFARVGVSLASMTVSPPDGALPLSVNNALTLLPPTTNAGVSLILAGTVRWTLNGATRDTLL